MRAIRARYNPYVQARARVDQLRRLGHPVDKVEFILMGGTFMSLPVDYRDYFIRNLHDALSGHASSSGDDCGGSPSLWRLELHACHGDVDCMRAVGMSTACVPWGRGPHACHGVFPQPTQCDAILSLGTACFLD